MSNVLEAISKFKQKTAKFRCPDVQIHTSAWTKAASFLL